MDCDQRPGLDSRPGVIDGAVAGGRRGRSRDRDNAGIVLTLPRSDEDTRIGGQLDELQIEGRIASTLNEASTIEQGYPYRTIGVYGAR